MELSNIKEIMIHFVSDRIKGIDKSKEVKNDLEWIVYGLLVQNQSIKQLELN